MIKHFKVKNSTDLQKLEAKFIKEFQILKKINHPNIVKLLDAFIDNNNFYLITELLFFSNFFLNSNLC